MQTIYLPSIKRLTLYNFSLYAKSEVVLDFEKSVSCIMGANGIGKSTLLNCINFAITGYINQPNKKVLSINDFLEENNYHLKYFDGRINETDKSFAEIEINYALNEKDITVRRKFFPSNKIISFEIDGESRLDYKEQIEVTAGVSQFSQFVFLLLNLKSRKNISRRETRPQAQNIIFSASR